MYPCAPEAEARVIATETLEHHLAELTGILNATHGAIVALIATALDQGLWQQHGIHSPAHWLAWQAGLSPAHAHHVVKLATRAGDLPCATAALADGSLSMDQAIEIAKHVPGEFDAGVTELAKMCTVEQLRRVLPRYRFNDQLADARRARKKAATADPGDDADSEPEPSPEAEPTPPVTERRELSMGYDDDGFWLHGRLPADQGALVERALRTATHDRYQQETADLGPADPKPPINLVDGLLAIAETALRMGQAAHPASDRYTIYAHLEAGPDGANLTTLHLGPVLPRHLHRLHTCDANIRPVLERDGVPCNVGRDQRLVPHRVRRLIEHRDQTCAVPGCHQRHGLQIHHITHWEDGGPTDTANLLTICGRHHRLHHLGLLGITGNADLGPHTPGGLTFTDKWNQPLDPTGTPTRPDHLQPLGASARAAGATPGTYTHPFGERLDPTAVVFYPTPPADPGPATPAPPPRTSAQPAA